MKEASPYLVFKRKDKPYYYVKYRNTDNGTYLSPISTRQTTKTLAEKIAKDWYLHGIPKKDGREKVEDCILWETARRQNLTPQQAEKIIKELQSQGLVKTAVMAGSKQDISMIDFMLDFWTWDKSPYIKEKLRKNQSIHKRHCARQLGSIRNYWKPYFNDILLGSITRQQLNDFVSNIGENQLTYSAKNDCIRAGTSALKWAYNNELIDKDITAEITFFSGTYKERQILSPYANDSRTA